MASVSDTFTRGDETPLAAPWVSVENDLRLSATTILGDGFAVRNCCRYSGAGLANNHESQIVVVVGPNTPDERFLGPAVRCQTGAASYYAFHSDTVQTKIIQVIAGTLSTLATGGAAAVVTDTMRLRAVTTTGVTTLTGFINDVQQLEVAAGTELSNGDPGMLIESNHAPSLDNFFAQDVTVGSSFVPDEDYLFFAPSRLS